MYIILLGELFNALSRAFLSGVYDSYIYDYLKSENKTKRMLKECGRTNFAMSSGAMFAAVFSAVLYDRYGTVVLLSLEFVLTLVSIVLLTTLPNPPSARPHARTLKEKFVEIKDTTVATIKKSQHQRLHLVFGTPVFYNLLILLVLPAAVKNVRRAGSDV